MESGNHKGSDFMNILFMASNLTYLSKKKLSLHTPEGRTMIFSLPTMRNCHNPEFSLFSNKLLFKTPSCNLSPLLLLLPLHLFLCLIVFLNSLRLCSYLFIIFSLHSPYFIISINLYLLFPDSPIFQFKFTVRFPLWVIIQPYPSCSFQKLLS